MTTADSSGLTVDGYGAARHKDEPVGYPGRPGNDGMKTRKGTSLVVQWLTLHAPNAGGPGSIPGQGTRCHTLQLTPGTAK